MITGDYVRMMASYGAWQNEAHLEACSALSEADLKADRGAFFGSIAGTANHLLWGDKMWLSRFAGTPGPSQPAARHMEETKDWAEFEVERRAADAAIIAWATDLKDAALKEDLTWHSGILARDFTKPLAYCIPHFFNHGTHHRGQVHAMLTAAGAKTEDTDLILTPGLA